MKQVEEENIRLRKLVSDLSLDREMLQEALRKKALVPDHKRVLADHLKGCFEVSKKRSCNLIQLSRTVFYYQSSKDDQAFLRSRIKEISVIRVRYGAKRIHVLLQREG